MANLPSRDMRHFQAGTQRDDDDAESLADVRAVAWTLELLYLPACICLSIHFDTSSAFIATSHLVVEVQVPYLCPASLGVTRSFGEDVTPFAGRCHRTVSLHPPTQ